jgi:hypothetical protein
LEDRAQLEKAYKIAAKIVAEHGDTYLPVFERLHNEIMQHESKRSLKELALKIRDEL